MAINNNIRRLPIFIFISTQVLILSLLPATGLQAQQRTFIHALNIKNLYGDITGITKDKEGYVWFSCNTSIGAGGLHRFDGEGTISYMHDSRDTNSLVSNSVTSLLTDHSGMIWVGTADSGLDRFDPLTKLFIHFKHNSQNSNSLCNNNINTLFEDNNGNIWIGTTDGLDKLDSAGKIFTHYSYQKGKLTGISDNNVLALYEDRNGNIWIGTAYGLDLLNGATGTFSFYFPCSGTSQLNNYCSNSISSIFEDSRKNFWVGTYKDGLMTLDRKSGLFTHYYYNPDQPHALAPPPPYFTYADPVRFINEDASGILWFGSYAPGICSFDPATNSETWYQTNIQNGQLETVQRFSGDSLNTQPNCVFNDKDGLFWIATSMGDIYYTDPLHKIIPYSPIAQQSANSFYKDENGNLWIGTDNGLVCKTKDGKEKIFLHDPQNPNSISSNGINVILPAGPGELWLGTNGTGVDKLNTLNGKSEHYPPDNKIAGSLQNGYILFLLKDQHNDLWVSTQGGLNRMLSGTDSSIHYRHNPADSNSIGNDLVLSMKEKDDQMWAGTIKGLDKLNEKTGRWEHYLVNSPVKSVYIDSKNEVWAGTAEGLFYFRPGQNKFIRFEDPGSGSTMDGVLNVIEDNSHRLWITTTNALYRISPARDRLFKYGVREGIHINQFLAEFSYKAEDGELFIGDQGGYYNFYPEQFAENPGLPAIWFTGFKVQNKEVIPGPGEPLTAPLSETDKISLKYNQNSISFDFLALHFAHPDSIRYRYLMENYDGIWHDLGTAHSVSFFGVPPGHYILRVRAITANDTWSEKDLSVTINPPWWTTWWAITLFSLILIGIVWSIIQYRSRQLRHKNKMLEEKVNERTFQLNKSLTELKATQKQLIQSEKLASLGEVTAGIAHEIQNPLNFVNNFSELSTELMEEMKTEFREGNTADGLAIAEDLKSNLERINHHGKRAQSIVSNMLEHSRVSSGHKELTDINALIEEYLQISYHAMLAKIPAYFPELKEWKVEMITELKDNLDKINIVPQDIGRVFLNIFNNAFYACAERSRSACAERSQNASVEQEKDPERLSDGYTPTVTVYTKKIENSVIISVRDNGNGIPEKIKGKIFQPFFTSKPTGQGTGLGLSLTYDIIKAQNGEINVETEEREGTTFILKLPIQ